MGPRTTHAPASAILGARIRHRAMPSMERTLAADPGMGSALGRALRQGTAGCVGADQPACKPGSVGPVGKPTNVAAIPLGRPLPAASSNQPGRRAWRAGLLSPRGDSVSPLFGFAPGGVYRAVRVAASAVRSYRTLSPLPHGGRIRAGRSALCCTIPGVAPAGRYPAPSLHGARTFLPARRRSGRPAG